MKQDGEVKDILVLAFLREGLDMRNRDLIEKQKKVAMSLLAHRHDIIARKRAYRAFILLERGISTDYREPTFKYGQSLNEGRAYLAQQASELEYGKKYPRLSYRVFHYLKSRIAGNRQRS